MEDDDGYDGDYNSDSDAYNVDNRAVNELYERLMSEISASMNNDDIDIEEDESDNDVNVSFDYENVDDEDDDHLLADDYLFDSMDEVEVLSETSTVVNDQQRSPSVSSTDVEIVPEPTESTDPVEEENIVQSQKKIKLDKEVEKKEETAIADNSIDEDQRCPICLDLWSNAGEHRLCSLRCGHLFGLKCIEQWFKVAPNATARKCPECNTKASKKDIRILYAKSLRCIDTIELEKLKDTLKDVSAKKENFELQIQHYKTKEVLYEQQMNSLRQKITELERTIKTISSERNNFSVQCKNIILKKQKIFNICNNGFCRVMAYNPWHKILVASSGNIISRIFMETLTASWNFPTHNGPIRDIAFQEWHSNVLLSVAFDKKIMLTDLRTNLTIHTYQENTPLWSCCYSNYRNQTFFVGGGRGNIAEYDLRYLRSSVSTKMNTEDSSPVVSLASVSTGCPAFSAGGYLACQLNSCYAYSFQEGNYVGNRIDIEGPFTSLRYNEKDNHALLSCRANAKNPSVRHLVCSLEKNENQIQFNTVHTFNAGNTQKLLSRPCYANLPNNTMVVTNNESLNSIVAWSVSSGQEVYNFPISEPVVDVCHFENDAMYQAVLTPSKLHLYHYNTDTL